MKTSDNLFKLISSMSKAEKGYFKKFSSMHTIGEKNNYVKLFDVIEKQAEKLKEYNEYQVKQRFDEKFNRQLPVVKNYLYSTILESLQLFHAVKDPHRQVQSLIFQSDILSGKTLTKQAEETLKKAKKIAEDREMLPEMLMILARERTFARSMNDPDEYEKTYSKIYADELDIIEKMENTADFANLRNKIIKFTSISGTGFVRSDEHKRELDELVSDPLLQPGGKTLTRYTKFYVNDLRSSLYLSQEDYESSYSCSVTTLEIREKEIGKLFNNHQLQVALFNMMVLQIRLHKYEGCDLTLDKIKNFEKHYKRELNETDKAFRIYTIAVTEIPFRIETLEKEAGLMAVKYVEEQLELYEMKIIPAWRLTTFYFMACFYFIIGDFGNCGKWLAKILQFPSDYSTDYQCYARIMNLIVHYELKNFDHIEYAMKSAYYFMRKRNKIYKYEHTIIRYMKRSLRARNEKELLKLFAEMKYDLEVLFNDNYEKNAFDAFNIIPWLESKIDNISVMEAVKMMKGRAATQ